MPITSPYSASLVPAGDRKDVIAGTSSVPVPGSVKVYIGADRRLRDGQSIQGDLTRCFNRLMESCSKSPTGGAAIGACTNGGDVRLTTAAGPADVMVCFGAGVTEGVTETFRQLLDHLREASNAN